MDVPSRSVNPAYVRPHRAEASKRNWEKCPTEFKSYDETAAGESIGTLCCEWAAGKVNAEMQMLVEANSKSHDSVIHGRLSHKGPV